MMLHFLYFFFNCTLVHKNLKRDLDDFDLLLVPFPSQFYS
jgi:hypothetical protein